MTRLLLDPVVDLILRGGLAALFGFAAWHKLRDLTAFHRTIRDYRLLPEWLVPVSATLLVGVEILIAFALLVPGVTGIVAALAAGALLAVYTLAIGINLGRGRRSIDCGCTGAALRQPISEWLLLRNCALIAMALVSAQAAVPRSLNFWDYGFAALALGAVVLLYASANSLLATGPLLQRWGADYE